MLGLPTFGARKRLELAIGATTRGNLVDAQRALRAYFSLRYREDHAINGIDAEAAMLASGCAMLAGDLAEFEGTAVLVTSGLSRSAIRAREWIAFLRDVAAGDVDAVFDCPEWTSPAFVKPLLPSLYLLASEKGLSNLSASHAEKLHAICADASAQSKDMRSRVALVRASVALTAGGRDQAIRELAQTDDGAPPVVRFLKQLALENFEAATNLVADLSSADHSSAASVVARLAIAAPSASVERYLAIVGPICPAQQRAALVATFAVALAREGHPARALSRLEEERSRSPQTVMVETASAFAALLSGDAKRAHTVVRGAAYDADSVALALSTLAMEGDCDRLVAELDRASSLSEAAKRTLAPLVLASLARAGKALDAAQTPDWLAARPSSADALYAWAILRLRQGALNDALNAFDEAVRHTPELARSGDSHDTARVAVAREMLKRGELDNADRLATLVTSPREIANATRLRALALLQRLSRQQGFIIDASTFADSVERLLWETPAGAEAHTLLRVLWSEASRMRARALLKAGKARESRAVLSRESVEDGDGAYLSAVTMVLEGASMLSVEKYLSTAIAQNPTNHKNYVLLSEIRGVLQGPDATLATLEPLAPQAVQSPLLQEALASAYGGVSRGLDAKKIGFAEVRRRGNDVPQALVDQIRDALAFEAPPQKSDHGRETSITRHPFGALPRDKVQERIDLLVARATHVREAEPLIARVKISALANDLDALCAVELELIALLGSVQ